MLEQQESEIDRLDETEKAFEAEVPVLSLFPLLMLSK